MGLLSRIRSWRKGGVKLGGSAANASPDDTITSVPGDHSPSRRPSRSSQQALSGYGNNPYDTYTWELHSSPDGDRRLKRAVDINKAPGESDPTNPYDTGAFRGPWGKN